MITPSCRFAPRRQYRSVSIVDRKWQREDETCDAGAQSVIGKTAQRGKRVIQRAIIRSTFRFFNVCLPAPIQRRRQQYAQHLNRL
jgi:hypothetical protein